MALFSHTSRLARLTPTYTAPPSRTMIIETFKAQCFKLSSLKPYALILCNLIQMIFPAMTAHGSLDPIKKEILNIHYFIDLANF
jgi:hypothetical protein